MPHLTFDGQSFLIDGKRIWMLGAGVQYARTPYASWPRMIAACRQAGFNTIETACPWIFHEPRAGRFDFDGRADVRQFVQLCADAGMYVILRIGPYINSGYDGGGLPAWLLQTPGLVVREGNEQFLERVNSYFQRLLAQVTDLQITEGGPIIAMQCEQDWQCANDGEATRYLRELTRNVRENGVKVPILNANDLWQETPGTIDTWQGWDELLVHLRQIRTIQPDRPAIVSGFDPASIVTWGEKITVSKTPGQILHRLAQVLTAGAQPIVAPFHGGSNVGAVGGRLAGDPDRYITQATAAGAPLGEAGSRTGAYDIIKRLVTFANYFGHVFGELDPAGHGPVLDVDSLVASSSGGSAAKSNRGDRISIVSLRGTQGDVTFAFAPEHSTDTEAVLLLENGMRLPIILGDQSVGWYAFDVDLRGGGRLDYTNLCPFAIVDRSILVLHGAAKSPALLSIDDTPIETVVPSGRRPTVVQVRDMTVVICSREQIDATYVDTPTQVATPDRPGGKAVYVGISGFDAAGEPQPHEDYPKAYIISRHGNVVQRTIDDDSNGSRKGAKTTRKSVTLRTWHAASCQDYVDGVSQRFATLDGPQTLATCGAPFGYGWYRIELDPAALKGKGSTRKRICHIPGAGDRVHLFIDGALHGVIGHGPGAERGPFELALKKPTRSSARGASRNDGRTVVALVDNLGRFSEGNDLDDRKGLYSHVYAIKPLTRSAGGSRPVAGDADPVHPFDVRGYIAGRTFGQLSMSRQLIWQFTHTRVTPLLLDIDGGALSGTLVFNGEPLAYYSGTTGGALLRLLLNPKEMEGFKRGKNELRFAPDPTEDAESPDALSAFARCAHLYECVENLTEQAQWSFAKWEPPMLKPPGHWPETGAAAAKSMRGVACWWQSRFTLPDGHSGPWWFDTNGLSKGQVFINGHHLGRYFTATATGKSVGPQTRLHLPVDWLDLDGENVLLIFDEHGFAPHRTKLVISDTGDLDQA